jgi:uncharacterized membrane-anchored protein YhcB (DUF1043 family)
MNLGAKLGIAGGGLVAVIALIVFIMNISYQNTYERIGQDIEAQYKKIETDYEKMSRIILQQAGIVNKYSKDFKDIYKGMMTGRYGEKGSQAMWQWIKEQNPQIDAAIYQKLMTTVEAQRTTFSRHQEKVAAMVAESNKMLKVAPYKWFVNGEIKEAKIVSSSKTKVIMDTGIDDSSNDLFKSE